MIGLSLWSLSTVLAISATHVMDMEWAVVLGLGPGFRDQLIEGVGDQLSIKDRFSSIPRDVSLTCTEFGIFCFIFAFCNTGMLQNAEITWKIPSSACIPG